MTEAAGAMMIPIPASGMLRSVGGIEAALAIPGITGIDITAKMNHPIQTLPEGASYLGFIFAREPEPDQVEQAFRDAHACLEIEISPDAPAGDAMIAAMDYFLRWAGPASSGVSQPSATSASSPKKNSSICWRSMSLVSGSAGLSA